MSGEHWSKPRYPGDAVRIKLLQRGDELGNVRIMDYRGAAKEEAPIRVAAFLPGKTDPIVAGDTPKTWPEHEQWCHQDAADYYFDIFVLWAHQHQWKEYVP